MDTYSQLKYCLLIMPCIEIVNYNNEASQDNY